MSTLCYISLLLFLCLSLYECNARPLAAMSKNHEVTEEGIVVKEGSVTEDHNGKQIDSMLDVKGLKGERMKIAAAVSWRVPHKKLDTPQPGFNLDYSPPKEHPGVHN